LEGKYLQGVEHKNEVVTNLRKYERKKERREWKVIEDN